jgi:2-C-methyl-D-erythritol 4-phosphate cytidylyltransferase
MQPRNSTANSQARYVALIPAAGVGARMGALYPKQYMQIAGLPVIAHTVAAFLATPQISHVFIVVSPEDAYIDDLQLSSARVTVLRCGGATRHESVTNGLLQMASVHHQMCDADWVLVHDAARLAIGSELISKLIETVADHAVGGLLALPVVDTVKRLQDGRLETICREGLWLAQTPQMFRHGLLKKALLHANKVTDEASAIEALGLAPLLVEGHQRNSKLTRPDDFAMIANYLNPI